MKNILLLVVLTLLSGCISEKKEKKESQDQIENAQTDNVETNNTETQTDNTQNQTDVVENRAGIVTNFLDDIKSLEKEDSKMPIVKFQEAANTTAEKVITLNKENIEAVLTEAKAYKYCVITTGDHTIVKIDDPENCKPSGSWGACMPYAEGYIKKGELILKKDYINYIIGQPDAQERTAYLFN